MQVSGEGNERESDEKNEKDEAVAADTTKQTRKSFDVEAAEERVDKRLILVSMASWVAVVWGFRKDGSFS